MKKEEIVELYRNGFTKTEIAKKLGKSRRYVHEMIGNRDHEIMVKILALNVDYPVPTASYKVLLVLQMFNEGASVEDMAVKARLTEKRVYDILRTYYDTKKRKSIRRRYTNTKTAQAVKLREQGYGVSEIGRLLDVTPQAAWTMSTRRGDDYKPTMTRDQMRLHHQWMTQYLDENGIVFDDLRVHRNNQYTIWIRDEENMGKALVLFPLEDRVYAKKVRLRVKVESRD